MRRCLSLALWSSAPGHKQSLLAPILAVKPWMPTTYELLLLPAGLEPAQVPDHLQAVHVDLKLSQVKTVSFLTYLVRRLPQQVRVV